MSRKKYHKHKILITNPVINSYAAKILLKEKYYEICDSPKNTWLKFRLELLTRWEIERGGLSCFYCGKGPLLKDRDNSDPMVATLDHKTPRARGGEEYNENNLVVCCYKCNQEKKDLSLEEFKKRGE